MNHYKLTFTFKSEVPRDQFTWERACEIYHRLVGQFYQREVDTRAGLSMMMFDDMCVGTSWDVTFSQPAALLAVINNPSIHELFHVYAQEA